MKPLLSGGALLAASSVLYLTGPRLGLPDLNRPAFERAARALRALGFAVLTPSADDTEDDVMASLSRDADALLGADAVVLLPGWESGPACRVEVALATALLKPCLPFEAALAA